MFKTEVATLPVSRDIMGLWFFKVDPATEVTRVTQDVTVGDIFTPLDNSKLCNLPSRVYHPDYAILGTYYPSNGKDGEINRDFFLSEYGHTHILYITGVPKGQKLLKDHLDRSKYRIEGAQIDFFHYWEDTHHGYLFQMVRLNS